MSSTQPAPDSLQRAVLSLLIDRFGDRAEQVQRTCTAMGALPTGRTTAAGTPLGTTSPLSTGPTRQGSRTDRQALDTDTRHSTAQKHWQTSNQRQHVSCSSPLLAQLHNSQHLQENTRSRSRSRQLHTLVVEASSPQEENARRKEVSKSRSQEVSKPRSQEVSKKSRCCQKYSVVESRGPITC